MILLGDLLTLYSLWTPAGRVSKRNVGDLVLTCPQSPLSWALEGRWSGGIASRRQQLHVAPGDLLPAFAAVGTTGNLFSPSGSPFASQVLGSSAVCQPRPTCVGFWLHCWQLGLAKVKTHGKNSCIPLHADFILWPGVKTVPLSLSADSGYCISTGLSVSSINHNAITESPLA